MKTFEHAKNYLAQGLSIIPIAPKEKNPIIKTWKEYQSRQATEDEINEWFKEESKFNIGIVTGSISGIVVIDVDSEEAMKFVEQKGISIGPMVKTRKGFHIYCKHKKGVRSFQDRDDLPGIDLRAEGGYVVAPPSIHESGDVYQWIEGHEWDKLNLPELPEWIIAINELGRLPIEELLEGVPEKMRHKALIRLSGHWLSKRHNVEEAIKKALEWNPKNTPPLEEKEIRDTVQDIFNRYRIVDDGLRDNQDDEISFLKLDNGRLAEMVYDPDNEKVNFIVYDTKENKYEALESIEHRGTTIYPYRNDRLIMNKENPVVWLPSNVEEYGSDKELFDCIKTFIHKYLALDEQSENLATTYVMFSWIYDCYTVLPYLRVLGDYGTGKSRFLYTIGLVCYKPMVIVAALGEAPLFRIIQKYRGTLVLDEANFQKSDVSTAIMQILNAGYEKKASVIRCGDRNYNDLIPFQVFSPKIISSREKWKDLALESRCITWYSKTSDRLQQPGKKPGNGDIPLYLDNTFNREALLLRNKLLMFRFRNFGEKTIDIERLKYPVEPRISQILLPLANLSSDEQILEKINNLAKKMHKEQIENRSATMAAHILQVIKDIEDSRESKGQKIYLVEIAEKLTKVIYGEDEKKKVATQIISNHLRSPELMIEIKPKDRKGKSIIFNPEVFEPLFKKYGITEFDESENEENVTSDDCDDNT